MRSLADVVDPTLTFIMTDQPEVCRHCGVRTQFDEMTTRLQIHQCPNCNYVYLLADIAKRRATTRRTAPKS